MALSLRETSAISPQLYIVTSAILGIVFMACMLPVPGYLAKSVEGVQAEKMKRVRSLLLWILTLRIDYVNSSLQTDSRVQAVTESQFFHGAAMAASVSD